MSLLITKTMISLLILSLSLVLPCISSKPVRTCSEQQKCLSVMYTYECELDRLSICLYFDASGECMKDSTDTIDYACNSTLEKDKIEGFKEGEENAMCISTDCSEVRDLPAPQRYVEFGVKDGRGCTKKQQTKPKSSSSSGSENKIAILDNFPAICRPARQGDVLCGGTQNRECIHQIFYSCPSNPTTSNESNPTTSNPTTSNPTTSKPTTSNPTTSTSDLTTSDQTTTITTTFDITTTSVTLPNLGDICLPIADGVIKLDAFFVVDQSCTTTNDFCAQRQKLIAELMISLKSFDSGHDENIGARVGYITFGGDSNDTKVVVQLTDGDYNYGPVSSADIYQYYQVIRNDECTIEPPPLGTTDLYSALDIAVNKLKSQGRSGGYIVKKIIVFSNCENTPSPSNPTIYDICTDGSNSIKAKITNETDPMDVLFVNLGSLITSDYGSCLSRINQTKFVLDYPSFPGTPSIENIVEDNVDYICKVTNDNALLNEKQLAINSLDINESIDGSNGIAIGVLLTVIGLVILIIVIGLIYYIVSETKTTVDWSAQDK